ncbi:hypothetical protein C8Q76DRAFT_788970 [Earliella scabrosa]|nr:hypothetical protein C8Q76DRAFT_788970 [Earliella scabrosa]
MPSYNHATMLTSVLLAASYYVVYITVATMWDSFENPPAVIKVWEHGVTRGSYVNTTVSFVTLPTSNEGYVCAVSSVDNVVSTVLAPAPAFAFLFEMKDLDVDVCHIPGAVSITFVDAVDLKLFAASLEGTAVISQAPRAI